MECEKEMPFRSEWRTQENELTSNDPRISNSAICLRVSASFMIWIFIKYWVWWPDVRVIDYGFIVMALKKWVSIVEGNGISVRFYYTISN